MRSALLTSLVLAGCTSYPNGSEDCDVFREADGYFWAGTSDGDQARTVLDLSTTNYFAERGHWPRFMPARNPFFGHFGWVGEPGLEASYLGDDRWDVPAANWRGTALGLAVVLSFENDDNMCIFVAGEGE